MTALVLPCLAAAFVWWASTGVLFWRMGLGQATHALTVAATTAAMGGAMLALLALRPETGAPAAYAGFLCGIAIWAWHEALFLTGYIGGPRRGPCPEGLSTWRRFCVSTEVVIYHEMAIAAHAVLIVALSWGAENMVAMWTFLLLWGMRINAKLVVFLGAPNISGELLPRHLSYLSTYFGRRRITAFFPLFITAATAAATALTYAALLSAPASGGQVGLTLLAALAWLAVLEHWALVLPLPDRALWRWTQQGSPGRKPDWPLAPPMNKSKKIGGSHGL
ncbi:MAG: putative photosynthetic complex assembly protein PuhE [Pseudomonadota bacterium]